jgi:hypothetical protein
MRCIENRLTVTIPRRRTQQCGSANSRPLCTRQQLVWRPPVNIISPDGKQSARSRFHRYGDTIMFEEIFFPRTAERYRAAPLVEQRQRYLVHLRKTGARRSTLRRCAMIANSTRAGGHRPLPGLAGCRRVRLRLSVDVDRSAKGGPLVGFGRAHGLREGDRTASGPGRQWLRPAIFRRARPMRRQRSMTEWRALHREAK